MFTRTVHACLALVGLCLVAPTFAFAQPDPAGDTAPQTGYALVNDLNMYYEIHGTDTGTPLVMLHGAYMSIDVMGEILPRLAETRQVIAVELQGHGRTGDIADRPLSYEQMADDVAGLMQAIGIEQADVFGYSLGGSTALQLVIRHPERVRKLVVVSATYRHDGWYPEVLAVTSSITPEMFAGTPMESEYQRLAPQPENWPTLISKLVALDSAPQEWPAEDIQAIESPTLLIIGDSDGVRPEHALELFKLLGGGVVGDFAGLPDAQLAVIPGATHVSVLSRVDLLSVMVSEFLDAPTPEAN